MCDLKFNAVIDKSGKYKSALQLFLLLSTTVTDVFFFFFAENVNNGRLL